MYLIFLIKNMCLMAFYFAFATLLFVQPVHKSMVLVYFITLVCFSLSYFFRFNEKYSKLKYLLVLGALIAIIYLRTITGALAVVFPFIYMILFVKEDEYYAEYNTFKDLFSKLTIAIVILMLVIFIVGWFELFKSISLQYVIVFFTSGLYLLRTARHSTDVIKNKVFIAMNILVIAITCIICLVLSSEIAINFIIYMLKLIYDKIFIPIIMIVVYAFMGLGWLLMKLVSSVDNNGTEVLEDVGEALKEIEDAQYYRNSSFNNETYFIILQIVSCILVIILFIFLIKKFLLKGNKDIEVEGIREYRSFLDDKDDLIKTNKRIFKNSLNQIRYWYRKFLVLCRRRKIDVGIFDSSQSIYDKSCDVFVNSKDELKSIREIYRKARYSKEIIDNNDVKKIKSFYKKLENEKNNKNQ